MLMVVPLSGDESIARVPSSRAPRSRMPRRPRPRTLSALRSTAATSKPLPSSSSSTRRLPFWKDRLMATFSASAGGAQVKDETVHALQQATSGCLRLTQYVSQRGIIVRNGPRRGLQRQDQGGESLAGLVVELAGHAPSLFLLNADELLEELAPESFLLLQFLVKAPILLDTFFEAVAGGLELLSALSD